MEIVGLQKLTLIDYPGLTACTLFLAGCNFRCPWCYSSEIVLPDKISEQPQLSQNDFLKFLSVRKGLLEGVVICGGEPTLNEGLANLLSEIKKEGFKIKLDTNGSNCSALEGLVKKRLVDYIAMDIKAPFRVAEYEKVTGRTIDLQNLEESVAFIKASGIDYEFRTTVVPLFHNKEKIKEIAKMLSPAKKYFLQNFWPQKTLDPSLTKVEPYPREFLEEIRNEIKYLFDVCEIR